MIPRLKPIIGIRDIVAGLHAQSGSVAAFEQAFAEAFDCRHGIMFPYGRVGLYALLKAWELAGDEVICPAYTCVVVPHAIVLSGNVPVFVDCAPGSYNMDLEGIRAAVSERTRCIVCTHLFGYPMDTRAVREIADEAGRKFGHRVYVVQDTAHSFGAADDSGLVTAAGDAAVFGLNISKVMNAVFGGMVITDDASTYASLHGVRAGELRPAGVLKGVKRLAYLVSAKVAFGPAVYTAVNLLERSGLLDAFVAYYDEGIIDFPSDWRVMPCNVEASVGFVQLRHYDAFIRMRRANAKYYTEKLAGRTGMRLLPYTAGATYSHFVIRVDDRDAWVKRGLRNGVQLGILIEYTIPAMAAYRSYARGGCPVSADYANHLINLPVWPGVDTAVVLKRLGLE